MKIGVVGSGIAGLAAAWLFSRSGHHVVVFEKSDQLGFDGAGVSTQALPSEVDVPLRLFNSSHWTLLSQLYDELCIEKEPVTLSQSYSDEGGCYLNVDLQSVFSTDLNTIFSARSRSILQQANKPDTAHDIRICQADRIEWGTTDQKPVSARIS